jgi:hypothetical protein
MAIALTVSDNITPSQNHHYLNQWPLIMLEDQWHFNQAAGIGAPVQTANDKGGVIYLQKERELIARSLERAALRMAQDLNYWISPAYFSEEIPIGNGVPIQRQFFQGRYCKMIELGKRATTLIQAGVAVSYSDPNSVGVNDTATVTIVTAVANAEVKLYFQVADGAPTAGDYRYEIEPTVVTDSGGTVTITAPRWLFVSPKQWAREYVANDPNFNSPNVVDTANASTGFVTAVDVYRVYTDTSDNIEVLSADGTLLQTYTGEIVDLELSAFRMGDLCNTVCWDKRPQRIRVKYHAGSPLVNNDVDSELMEGCCAFSAGAMTSELSKMSYWTLASWQAYHNPMVKTVGGSIIPTATKSQANSGYGAAAGQITAWGIVMDRRLEKGHKFSYRMY